MVNDDRPIVLLVDDEQEILKLMYRQLAQLPYNVIPTTSPAEAIHILETREVAVLICDLHMPHMDGNTILTKARACNPDIVSIALSGGADYSVTVKALNEGGIWKYIGKPWNTKELIEVVHAAVTRYITLCQPHDKLRTLASDAKPGSQENKDWAMNVESHTPAKAPKRIFGKKANLQDLASTSPIEISGLLGDRYELGGILGEGGLGIVYKANDLMLNMPVAVKILNAHVSTNAKAINTLKEEARIAMQLSHKHIVRLHNLQKEAHSYYLVMEYVKGRTLWDILEQQGTLGLDTVLQIVYVCADAISYAHRRGILHKDLKPDNILLTDDGLLKVIDFGIACLANTQELTDTIMGTPAYMSPEQIRGDILDMRTDVYSMGIIVYELLTGRPPFPDEVGLDDIQNYLPVDLSSTPIPGEVAHVIDKAISPDRKHRWKSIFEFSTALIDSAQDLM